MLAVTARQFPLAPLGESGTLKEIVEQVGAIDVARYLAGLRAGA